MNTDKKSTSLVFTGDCGFDKYMEGRFEDDDLLSSEVLGFLKSGEHLIVNVEGPLSDRNKKVVSNGVEKLMHTMDPKVCNFLNRIGTDVWNICNNHICDAGPEGIEDTVKLAKENNVKTVGAGMNLSEAMAPVIFNEAGGIGMISVGYQRACRKASDDIAGCFSWSDMDNIKSAIVDIKKSCRWCIVIAHGGEEFTSLPSRYTRDRYMEYLNMGADIVVSHHPHVPLNYETFDNKAIFYSLGNFIFDTDYQRSQFNTEVGVLLRLNINEDSFSFDPFGILIDRVNERVVKGELPDIFTEVNETEYNLLEPLAAKMFIEATKRQLKYLKPDEFKNASEKDFVKNFYEPLRSGRVPGEVLDMQIMYPISLKYDEGTWKKSTLTKVKDYILRQI